MYQSSIELKPASIIADDIEVETPALAAGVTRFWRDDSGEWQDVTVIDCDPVGWGWCTIQYSNYDGRKVTTKSVPIVSLSDLDERLTEDTHYSRFELANDEAEYNARRSAGARGYLY